MRRAGSSAPTRLDVVVRDLGRVPYADALALQRQLHGQVVAARDTPGGIGHLLLLEHDPPVITVSRRRGAGANLLAGPGRLAEEGVEVAETDRGGDVTYHGPGQIVAYPILDLNVLNLRLGGYMRFLEQVVIDVLAGFAIEGRRDPQATGVWVESAGGPAKICAMGVRVARWVSMHGLALNVTANLEHFELIVPCGLPGRPVTSMERELGAVCPPLAEVKTALAGTLCRAAAAQASGA